MKKRTCEDLPPDSEGQEKENKQTEADEQTSTRFHKALPRRHASIPLRTFEVRVDPASFHPPFLCTLLELHRTTGTLKAEPFGQFVPQQFEGGGEPLSPRPSLPTPTLRAP